MAARELAFSEGEVRHISLHNSLVKCVLCSVQSLSPGNLKIPPCKGTAPALKRLTANLVYGKVKAILLAQSSTSPADAPAVDCPLASTHPVQAYRLSIQLNDTRTLDCWSMGERMLRKPVQQSEQA